MSDENNDEFLILTERLELRELKSDDSTDLDFIVTLLNEPSFLRFIGDRGVRSRDDAVKYIANGPNQMMKQHRFALLRVALRSDTQRPIGLCGVLKRDALEFPDIGFAFLPAYWSQGYAFEAAQAAIQDVRARLPAEVRRILAIASADNVASIRLLTKLGFIRQSTIKLTPEATDTVELFANDPPAAPVDTASQLTSHSV
jgi:ribosomal-protein-alanine N-acetyltransferase